MATHEETATVLQDRLSKLWQLRYEITEEAKRINLLTFAHHVLTNDPTAVWADLSISDQGGETMVLGEIELANGDGVDDDELQDYVGDMTWDGLRGWEFWTYFRNGTGRLNIPKIVEALEPLYREFVAGSLPPMPDPKDREAVTAWLDEKLKADA